MGFPYKVTPWGIFVEVVSSAAAYVRWEEVCPALLKFCVCAQGLLVCLLIFKTFILERKQNRSIEPTQMSHLVFHSPGEGPTSVHSQKVLVLPAAWRSWEPDSWRAPDSWQGGSREFRGVLIAVFLSV